MWGLLEEGARERLGYWDGGREEGLKGIQSGARGGSREMREAAARDSGEEVVGRLDPWELFSDTTRAMVRAMAALFAIAADQIPQVAAFRERVLPGRFLTADEAHGLIASYAARTFSRSWFEEWGIPFVGHHAAVVDTGPRGEQYNPVDDTMTIKVDPPGITKTVRYAWPKEGDSDTRCMARSGAIIPIHDYLPMESHGDHDYASWLWPGSVVDELYELSTELADAFDWSGSSSENLTGTRSWSRAGAWFILTGEAPQVRPIDARWMQKRVSSRGSRHLRPQWRIQLTIPPWLPEEEALSALRTLRRQRPGGHKMPKTTKPLDVARFVWDRERLDGHRERPPWTKWVEQWNDEHPGHRIDTASHFRTYFFRGNAAASHLNLDPPIFERPRSHSDARET